MRLLLTISQTGHCLNIGRTKTYELARAGELELVKIGSKSLITVRSIQAFLAKVAGIDGSPDIAGTIPIGETFPFVEKRQGDAPTEVGP